MLQVPINLGAGWFHSLGLSLISSPWRKQYQQYTNGHVCICREGRGKEEKKEKTLFSVLFVKKKAKKKTLVLFNFDKHKNLRGSPPTCTDQVVAKSFKRY